MAVHSQLTRLNNLINPEILGAMLSARLPEVIRFTQFAPVDTTIQGVAGDTIRLPRFEYIGQATHFGEGEAIDYRQLSFTDQTHTIRKAGVGVQLTDEVVLNSHGNAVQESLTQIVMAIADRVENDVVEAALASNLTVSGAMNVDLIDQLEDAFQNAPNSIEADFNGVQGVIFLNPTDVRALRKAVANDWERASDLGDNIISTGVIGGVLGWQVIPTMRVNVGQGVAMKAGAMRIYLNRNTLVETDRDIDHKLTKMNADQHYVAVIHDETLVVRINVTGGAPASEPVKAEVKKAKK